MASEKEALEYHQMGRPGKVEIQATKPCHTERELSLAYSPGVAYPCIQIAKDPLKAYDYTARGNLVAVITNGTAVLGLGNIGPLAGKPVMEGKSILFKKFADIDVFDIELNCSSTEEFINTVKALEPTFGGINLEDIKAPECFEIEEALKKELNIPVFHDDQHGTAIISGAGLINAVKVTNRKMEDTKLVMNGAGASSVSCARLFKNLGIRPENLIMCDSKGVIYKGRKEGMNRYKEEFANDTSYRTLEEALDGADVFVGLSVAGAVTPNMIKNMAKNPIIFAMANPTPEIMPDEAKKARPDAIVATGRSDFPNQVNNVLGFPFIFRGALDVRATTINEEMKLAAVNALASLAREEVPESVTQAYGGKTFRFGPDYLIPKPFDPRVLLHVAPAVAKAAMESEVAQKPITDFQKYHDQLESQFGPAKSFIRAAINRVKDRARESKEDTPHIIFPEGTSEKVLKAVQIIVDEGLAHPILLGYEDRIREKIERLELDNLKDVPIIHPTQDPKYSDYVNALFDIRKRKGVHIPEAKRLIADPNYFAAMAVQQGDADGMINGAAQNYADSVRPILEIIGSPKNGVAAGVNIMIVKEKVLFFCDTTLNIDPSAEQLAAMALQSAELAQYFNIEPRIAMLSFSNFTGQHTSPRKMKRAAEIASELVPELIVDGEVQADAAINPEVMNEFFPFSEIIKGANVLIFPNLDAGNIAYKLLQQLGGAETLGPFLMGVRRPAHVLQRSCQVNDIVNTAAMTALHVQALRDLKQKRNQN